MRTAIRLSVSFVAMVALVVTVALGVDALIADRFLKLAIALLEGAVFGTAWYCFFGAPVVFRMLDRHYGR